MGIVNDVLDLAKLESGTMTFDFMEFDLRQLIVETVASFQIKVPRGVALTYPESLNSFLLRSDRIRLKQVLGNFITNAIKYTSIGSIILSYQSHGERGSVIRDRYGGRNVGGNKTSCVRSFL